MYTSGYVEEYDESVKEIEELSLQLDEYLKSQRKLLGTQVNVSL